jgi:superfamily II DNA or RNA helicase/predicted RNA methylase
LENLQEILDASSTTTKQTLRKGSAQYFTPPLFARQMAALLPGGCSVVFDPQSGESALLDAIDCYGNYSFGVEIDTRIKIKQEDLTRKRLRLTASCLDVWRLLDEFYPKLTFRCQVANPPFGLRWKLPDGTVCDSTEATWQMMLRRAGSDGVGFMISNRPTLERLKIHECPHVYLYQTFPLGVFDAEVEIGVVHFAKEHTAGPKTVAHASADPELVRSVCDSIVLPNNYWPDGSPAPDIWEAFVTLAGLIAEEKRDLPPFNIYLTKAGFLRTQLSVRDRLVRQVSIKEVEKLARINNTHPLTLTTERESRLLLQQLVLEGVYTVQPEAKAAVEDALREMASIACPIMPITDFERVAYADEMEALEAKSMGQGNIYLTPGKRYPTNTATYEFTDEYQRMRLHMAEGQTYAAQHQCKLTGQDRFISILDDDGTIHRFLDRPDPKRTTDHSDELLWQLFAKPEVLTIADKFPEAVRKNVAVMDACELLAGFEYFAGQRDFYARVAVRDYALVGAATGTGKTLGAITLIALKAPKRALIIAPQGTTRASEKDEDEVGEMAPSQWISELRRFAPGLQVFELFNEQDYQRILACNRGELPHGVYVSYYEAMFSNNARESWSKSFDDVKLYAVLGQKHPDASDSPNAGPAPRELADTIGEERNGIRCIVTPCLATRIGHLFDFVALDEAHKGCHLSANLTQMIIRLQPRFRYALTATPIPNLVTDIFPLMGWLCVPGWYRNGIRNAAWPYAREDGYRFSTTFLSTERDLTQERMNRQTDPMWRGKCERASPVISAPARLLKLIKPTMAFISKEACNPHKPKLTVHDVRVPMGRQQARLYAHFMNRANVPGKNAMIVAAVQVAILRDLCASPGLSDWNNGVESLRVRSNFNPKTAAILSLVCEMMERGEQFVIVCARVKQSAYLQARLAEVGIVVSRIDSSIPPERHTEQANLFKQQRTPGLLMGIKCAQAHSFDRCPNLIVGSLEYSFGSFEQASGRIDRVTSKLPPHIWCVLHTNTIEEIMFDIVATKGDAATICLRGQRVPRNFVPADLGDVLAKNFALLQGADTKDLPEESTTEAGWPALARRLRAAAAEHPCQLARNG